MLKKKKKKKKILTMFHKIVYAHPLKNSTRHFWLADVESTFKSTLASQKFELNPWEEHGSNV